MNPHPPPQRVLTRRDGVCYRVDRQHKHQHLRSRCQYGMNTSPHYVHWGPRDRLDDELAFPPPVSLTCLPGCCFLFSSFSKSNPPRVARNCCRHANSHEGIKSTPWSCFQLLRGTRVIRPASCCLALTYLLLWLACCFNCSFSWSLATVSSSRLEVRSPARAASMALHGWRACCSVSTMPPWATGVSEPLLPQLIHRSIRHLEPRSDNS